ncbi:hypothetical protein L2E82_33301 [Cichorium intybus]|uniref:Uncharacterized protein n=1 Tax=Cichorium intybus TaxID=13427 RepID=A0ACB9BJR9_CICIN|nr:hypothetical protein L2E82_33301 [Cichorium intybus]
MEDRRHTHAKILNNVFGYAFSHGVKLEAFVSNSRNHTWPICLRTSFESLTNLKLKSWKSINCPYLGPRSGAFKNLNILHLEGAIITDVDPFSGTFDDLLSLFCAFPNAKSLRLFFHIVDVLSLFQHELVKRSSPFRKLKCLELDFSYQMLQNCFDHPGPSESYKIPSNVKDYLLQNSPDAKVTISSFRAHVKAILDTSRLSLLIVAL